VAEGDNQQPVEGNKKKSDTYGGDVDTPNASIIPQDIHEYS
jgi:hypothetical protein